MVVQHNVTAMNANRQLGITTGIQSKSSEKLSSGYKINRAADDAAGLSISEKMRRQIRGITQASAMLRMVFLQYRQLKVPSTKYMICFRE
jgi:flagellin